MIENYLAAITFIVSAIVLLITAGPGSLRPLYPDRAFLYFMCMSLMCASVYHLVRLVDPSDTGAKVYAQTINCVARTGMALAGTSFLFIWGRRCHSRQRKS